MITAPRYYGFFYNHTAGSSFPTPVIWLDAAVNCPQGSSASVGSWTDKQNNVIFTQSSAGSQPIHLLNQINGKPANTSDATNRNMSTATGQAKYDDLTVFAVIQESSNNTFFSKGDSNITPEYYMFYGANLFYFDTSYNAGGIPNGTQYTIGACIFPAAGSTAYQIHTIQKRGAHAKYWLNGGNDAVPNSGPVATQQSTALGTLTGAYNLGDLLGSGTTNFGWAELLVYNRKLSTSEMNVVQSYLISKYGIGSPITASSDRKAIYFMGDSMMAGIGIADPTQNLPGYCIDGTGALGRSTWDYANDGMSYLQASEMLTLQSASLLQFLQPNDVVVAWAGTNDIHYSQSAAQITGSIQTFCQNIKNLGYNNKIIYVNILNRFDFTGSAGSVTGSATGIQKAVNDWLTANSGSSFLDRVVDAQHQTNLQDSTNATYFQASSPHLTATGMAIVGGLTVTAINN